MLPLSGVRVLDLTNVLSGPLATYQLAMLGAEVIKIEVPGRGDLSRTMGCGESLIRARMGDAFCAINAGKRSITLNLKAAEGRAIFLELARGAAVVVENFRPGVMDKLGLGWEVLRQANTSLVYCAISGFGQQGPLSQRPSYDQIIQGMSGLMSLTGEPEGDPARAGYVVCDTIAAITAAFAISAALHRRAVSGEGEMIDVAMLDASLASMGVWSVANYLNGGQVPARMGNHNPLGSPSGTFRTGEGMINIVTNEDKQFEALAGLLGHPEWTARFPGRLARIRDREEIRRLLEEALQARSAREWEQLFNDAGVPAGRVLTVPEVLDHPQVRGRSLLKDVGRVDGAQQPVQVTRLGFQLASGLPDVDRPPPTLGSDTADILEELGITPEDQAALFERGVI